MAPAEAGPRSLSRVRRCAIAAGRATPPEEEAAKVGDAAKGRQRIGSGGPFEASAGYARAVRVGDTVYVAGTAAYRDGQPVAPGDPVTQTRHILGVIERALAEAGATMAEVVRYRV